MKKFLLYSFFVFGSLIALTTLFFSGRQMIVRAQIRNEPLDSSAPVPNLGVTTRLEIIPLYEEDRMDENFEFGHGVSYLIRTDSSTILMDVGNNPNESAQSPALKNMRSLGIAWQEIEAIMISHPHPDHVGGVSAWQNQTISFGDLTADLSEMLIYTPTSVAYPTANVFHSVEPTLISRDIGTTGMISYAEVFPIFLFDPKGQEQAIVIHVDGHGLVVITGCGHPTMEKLVSRAEALFGKKVVGVVGGLHYEKASTEDVQSHIQFLEPRVPTLIALSPHDSSLDALKAFQSAFPQAYRSLRVGDSIQFP